jgi:lysophospholipase L1-like esterase
MSGDPRWFYDGSHFNDAGSDRAAALIAEYLQSRPLDP